MKSIFREIMTLILLIVFSSGSVCAVTVNDIIQKLEQNATKIKDMQANVEMRISFEGESLGSGTDKTQKMKIYTKGKDKARIDIKEPTEQTIIINKDKMLMESTPQNGDKGKIKKVVTIDSITSSSQNMNIPGTDLSKTFIDLLKKSDTQIVNSNGIFHILKVTPKNTGSLIQKIELVVDYNKGIITTEKIFANNGTSLMNMQYQKIDNIWVLTYMEVTSPIGTKKMKMTSIYKNIQINKGIPENKFIIKE